MIREIKESEKIYDIINNDIFWIVRRNPKITLGAIIEADKIMGRGLNQKEVELLMIAYHKENKAQKEALAKNKKIDSKND